MQALRECGLPKAPTTAYAAFVQSEAKKMGTIKDGPVSSHFHLVYVNEYVSLASFLHLKITTGAYMKNLDKTAAPLTKLIENVTFCFHIQSFLCHLNYIIKEALEVKNWNI